MTRIDRRQALWGLAAGSAFFGYSTRLANAQSQGLSRPEKLAAEPHASLWSRVQNLYDVDRSISNLENGYWGIMARPVAEEYIANIERVNRQNTLYARTTFGKDFEQIRERVAQAVGADIEEIALTRGATEALQALISGYNALPSGSTVLYSDLDYDSMQYTMNWLKERRGVNIKTITIPEPATRENVLEAYKTAIETTPELKLILLTHLSHRTGLVMPIKEIADMARQKGIDVIVDAAHSWGQIDFNVKDLGADFVGFNLHKWIGAPLGVGFLYIKKERLNNIDRYLADEDWPQNDVRSRVHTGTLNFAAALTIPAALKLHETIGARNKEDRLRHLRNYWVSRVQNLENIDILTPNDPSMHAGITSLRFKGKTSKEDNNKIVDELRSNHKVMTVRRAGVSKGQCIRITPALYTREEELDRLVEALRVIQKT